MKTYRKVIIMGTSYGITIPKRWIVEHGITAGTFLSIEIEEDKIIIHAPKAQGVAADAP